MLWDIEHKKLIELTPGDRVLSVHGPQLLVRRGRAVWQWSPEQSHQLAAPINELSASLRQGRLLLVPPYVFDTQSGSLLGKSAGKALALSRAGHVLTAAKPSDAERLATGPLHWNAIEPATTAAPPGVPATTNATAPVVPSAVVPSAIVPSAIVPSPPVSDPAKPSTSVDQPPTLSPVTPPSEE